MVIVLVDGKILNPKGSVHPDTLGLTIMNGAERLTIPHNQIKWVYENPNYMKEELFIKGLKLKSPAKPFKVNEESTEMMKGLYE